MKEVLFKTVGSVSASLVQLNVSIGTAVASFIAFIFNGISTGIARMARTIMRAIDAERFDCMAAVLQQQCELSELSLLKAARQVKEDALAGRVWTVGHTIAINRIAGALHHNCGWEPVRIHQYLRDVVESIPGMVYSAGDDLGDSSDGGAAV